MLGRREVEQMGLLNQVLRVDLIRRVTFQTCRRLRREPSGELKEEHPGRENLSVAGMFKEQQGGKPGWRLVSRGEVSRDERKEVMGDKIIKEL